MPLPLPEDVTRPVSISLCKRESTFDFPKPVSFIITELGTERFFTAI